MNDEERRLWVLNTEDLYYQWHGTGKGLRTWIKANRPTIDQTITNQINRQIMKQNRPDLGR